MQLTFEQLKNELLESALKFQNLIFQRNEPKLVESIEELKKKLESNRFNLVVLGQFKRGKTTFINSLIEDDILPVAVVPLTSIVTVIRYGKSLQILVHFISGEKRKISKTELVNYVTEKGNPCNEKDVDFVEISYPSSFLADGVQLIDTPGVGSIYQHNTDVAYQYLPKVDAAIFLVAADPPISRSEHLFLSDIKEYAQKIFFLQNKIDYVEEDEREESLQFTKKVIEQDLGITGITIYPISAKLAFQAKKEKDPDKLNKSCALEFESVLKRFLMEEKGYIVLFSALSSFLRTVNTAVYSIELERKALEFPVNELDIKLKTFNEASVKFKEDKDDLNYLLKGEIKKIMNNLDMHIDAFKKEGLNDLKKQLVSFLNEQKGNPVGHITKNLDSFLTRKIEEKFNPFRNKEEDFAVKSFEKVVKKFSAHVNGIIDRIYEVSGELFNIKFEKYSEDDLFSMDSDFYYLVSDIKVGIEMIASGLKTVLPGAISHKLLSREAEKNLERVFDRQCGRVRWDILERMQESTFRFEGRLKQKIDSVIEGIQTAIERAAFEKEKGEEETQKSSLHLNKILIEINEIKVKAESYLENLRQTKVAHDL